MKTASHYSLFLLLALLFLLQGCKPDDDTGPNVTDTDYQAIKDYTYFKPGTYWIYEDSHGNIDSMFVYESGEGLDTASGYRYFTSRAHSSFDNYDYRIFYNSGWTTFHPTRHKVFMNKSGPGDYVGEIMLMEYPFINGNKLYWDNSNIITTKDFFADYLVNSLSFSNVVKMNESIDVIFEYQETNYFIAEHFGIIQKELLDSNDVWKLMRYNILQ